MCYIDYGGLIVWIAYIVSVESPIIEYHLAQKMQCINLCVAIASGNIMKHIAYKLDDVILLQETLSTNKHHIQN